MCVCVYVCVFVWVGGWVVCVRWCVCMCVSVCHIPMPSIPNYTNRGVHPLLGGLCLGTLLDDPAPHHRFALKHHITPVSLPFHISALVFGTILCVYKGYITFVHLCHQPTETCHMVTYLQENKPLAFFNVLERPGGQLTILGGMGVGLARAFHKHGKPDNKPKK